MFTKLTGRKRGYPMGRSSRSTEVTKELAVGGDASRTRLISRCLLVLSLAVVAIGSPAKAASAYDTSCSTSDVSANVGFSTYWVSEGVGLVGWRVAPHFIAKDRCDHGALLGSVSIYAGNIRAKGGYYQAYVSYKTTYQTAWTRSLVSLVYVGQSSTGYDVFSIRTNNNIGLTRTGRITAAKVSVYLVFGGVPGAARRVSCNTVAPGCGGYYGL